MSVSDAQARQAARQTIDQDAGPSNVRNLRPMRTSVYDANAELRPLTLSGYEWTLVTIGLRQLGVQAGVDLADLIEHRLRHPSSQVPS